jgi:hypothetical protein
MATGGPVYEIVADELESHGPDADEEIISAVEKKRIARKFINENVTEICCN